MPDVRIALAVGVNYYDNLPALYGCVDDAHAMKAALSRHDGGMVNFDCKLLTATGASDRVTRDELKDQVTALFRTQADIALFYFAGHGHVDSAGGYLLASDCSRVDAGLSLGELLNLANTSPARNKIVVLDSCHSGLAGNVVAGGEFAALTEGLTILTASTQEQYACEENGRGVFTALFVDALNGGAANLTGDVTPASVYAHIDQSLGWWEQRPVFKTNVKQFVSLRKVTPPIGLPDLQKIAELFPTPGYSFQLDPSFEPELKGRSEGMPPPNPENTSKFALLQKYNRLNLLVPIGVPHMWNAAMESKTCRLTVLGEHYRRLVIKNRI